MSESLRAMLVRHEGIRLLPYTDTVGKLTIGIGRNLTDNGITLAEADIMFDHDVSLAVAKLRTIFPGFDQFFEARQNALISMMFNLGATRFCKFRKMIAAIESGDWQAAAGEMRNSLWASQLPGRVAELAKMVETGE